MANKTAIPWTGFTWNPTRGCSPALISANGKTITRRGCDNCWAMTQAATRFSGPGMAYEGLAIIGQNGPKWTGRVELVEDSLEDPLKIKEPNMIFVDSMSDLFHHRVPVKYIAKVFAVMRQAWWHKFQVLTKRYERMHSVLNSQEFIAHFEQELQSRMGDDWSYQWPLPNVWLVLSIEDDFSATSSIPYLVNTPAAIRGVSFEPALDYIFFDVYPWFEAIDWGIVGGESASPSWNAREFDVDIAATAIDIFRKAGKPLFVKQMGSNPVVARDDRRMGWKIKQDGRTKRHKSYSIDLKDPKGENPEEWPEAFRVREFPEDKPYFIKYQKSGPGLHLPVGANEPQG